MSKRVLWLCGLLLLCCSLPVRAQVVYAGNYGSKCGTNGNQSCPDWCAEVMAADSQYASTPVEIWVDHTVTSTTSCSQQIALSASHVLRFVQGGSYTLGVSSSSSSGMAPGGAYAGVICSDWGTTLNYLGAGWAYDVNTQSYTDMENCQIRISGSAAGGARFHTLAAAQAPTGRCAGC